MFPRAAGPLTPARAALWPGCACLFFQSRCPPPPPPPALRRIASGATPISAPTIACQSDRPYYRRSDRQMARRSLKPCDTIIDLVIFDPLTANSQRQLCVSGVL